MTIKFTNGAELNPIVVTGAQTYVQGAKRDTLTFVFPATESMEALDEAFTETNCESITIVGNDGSESIHKAYTIRHELKKTAVEVAPATAETEAVTEERITVSMAQRTYMETQLANTQATLDALLVEEE